MDILEPSIEVKQDLLKIIKSLQWGKNLVDVKGSASLASQKYFGDYDLFSIIKSNKEDPNKEVLKILKKVSKNSNIYFIELKIQFVDGDKIKYDEKTIKDLSKEDFEKKPIDYVKLDFVVKIENEFFQLSINYIFNMKEKKNDLAELRKNMKELIDDQDYFKALKRQFSIYKLQSRKDKLVELTRFFNSETGRKNQILGNLNAMQQLLEHGAKSTFLLRKIIVALKDLGYQPPKSAPAIYEFIKEEANKLKQEINDEAKLLI